MRRADFASQCAVERPGVSGGQTVGPGLSGGQDLGLGVSRGQTSRAGIL
ncbi:MAG: hypothetical protein JO247_08420 [Chloroflexi bacterium]|nr:hypothetical protein [Chloroflexota bacterium]